MPERTSSLRRWLAAALGTTAVAGSAAADEPDITLRYDGLARRQEFTFKLDAKEYTRPVGVLGWEFPPAALTTVGFDHYPLAFCLEPLIPVTAGQQYGFTVNPFGKPRDFAGMADDKDGRAAADTRAKYVRELYARHYADAVKDPIEGAAFQSALWELVSETTAPVAPAGYSLYSGTFQTVGPEASAPVFVSTAEGYLKGLTGDDSGFATAPLLAGRELVRLDGSQVGTDTQAQAQITLRNRGGSNTTVAPFGADPGSFGGLGGGSNPLAGMGNRFSPAGGGGMGGGGGGFGGGGGSNLPLVIGGGNNTSPPTSGGTTSPPPTGTIENPGGSNPINPLPPPGVPIIPPVSPPSGVFPPPGVPPVSPPLGVPPVSPPPGVSPISPPPGVPPVSPPLPPDPEPVPGPAGVLLGVVAAGVFGVRRMLNKKGADTPPVGE